MSDLLAMQERLAHLERQSDDLSAVVARQDAEIARLTRAVAFLMERERDREAALAEAPAADAPPPHW